MHCKSHSSRRGHRAPGDCTPNPSGNLRLIPACLKASPDFEHILTFNNTNPSQHFSGRVTAHAWVTDGAQVKSITIRYVLYRLSDTAYPEFEYVAAENADPFDKYGDACYYHMNWGWGGNRDGWFMDGNIAIPGMDNSYNFRYNRKDLFINN